MGISPTVRLGKGVRKIGIELARAYVTVRGDASHLKEDFQDMQNQIGNTLRSIAMGVAAILGPAAALGRGILLQGTESAKAFEMITVEMETMLGSAEETQTTLERLTRFAVETPFEMPQLLQVTKGLVQFGERGDELFQTLKMLGDASGGTAEKFSILGLVFNQIRGVGKLTTQDFYQLSTRGLISLQDISKFYYGVSDKTKEAKEKMSSGKIPFEDFRKILMGLTQEGGRFHNMMEKQSHTLGGLISTFNDSYNITKRMLAEPLVPYLKSLYTILISLTDQLGIFVRYGGEAISFAFAGATAFSALGLAIAGTALAASFLGISLKAALLGTGIGAAIVVIGAAVGYLVHVFDLLGKAGVVWEWIQKNITQNVLVTERLSQAWDRVVLAMQILWDTVQTVFAGWANELSIFQELWDEFSKALTDFPVQLAYYLREAAEWINAFVVTARPLIIGFGKDLVTVIQWLGENWLNILRDMMNAIPVFLRNFLENMMISIKTNYRMWVVWQGFLLGIFKRLFSFEVLDAVLTGLIIIGEKIREWADAAWKTIQSIFTGQKPGDQLKDFIKNVKSDFEKGMNSKNIAMDLFSVWKEGLDEMKGPLDGLKLTITQFPKLNIFNAGEFWNNVAKAKDAIAKLRLLPKLTGKNVVAPDEKKIPEKYDDLLKPGISDVEKFGKSIQDVLLKKGDPQLQTNELLKEGNKIQEKTLKATQEIGGNMGLK